MKPQSPVPDLHEDHWRLPRHCLVVAVCLLTLVFTRGGLAAAERDASPPLEGFTLHWDFVNSDEDLDRLLSFVFDQGAQILNVVPPPHIWEDPKGLAALERVFDRTREHGVGIVLNRIDGSSFAPNATQRTNWLYTNILTEPGRLPSGKPTPDFFLATVGKVEYERWLREETAFYADRFSGRENLLAFSVGGFNEPFVSQRGSLLCYDETTRQYEVGQYTPFAHAVFRRHVERLCHGSLDEVNRRYRSRFASIVSIPLPKSENDPAFGDPALAYWDFVSAINGWVVEQLDACQGIWRSRAKRPVPFVLQLNGAVVEKLALGRPAFAALDISDWISRADALGLSLYTNCGFADWGHASDSATVGLLGLGELLGKDTYVLETGSECDGAVLRPGELGFIARSVRALRPKSVIYEFTKTSYCESFGTSAGKLLNGRWEVNARAVRSVRRALTEARQPDSRRPGRFVFDPLGERPDPHALLVRRELMRYALRHPLTFVTREALEAIPAGSTLYVADGPDRATLAVRLSRRGIRTRSFGSLIGAAAVAHEPNGNGEGAR